VVGLAGQLARRARSSDSGRNVRSFSSTIAAIDIPLRAASRNMSSAESKTNGTDPATLGAGSDEPAVAEQPEMEGDHA